MIQYMMMQEERVKNKDGDTIVVKGFRDRIEYEKKDILKTKIYDSEVRRMDLFIARMYNSFLKIGGVIDANDEDIFSFNKDDYVNFINKDIVV